MDKKQLNENYHFNTVYDFLYLCAETSNLDKIIINNGKGNTEFEGTYDELEETNFIDAEFKEFTTGDDKITINISDDSVFYELEDFLENFAGGTVTLFDVDAQNNVFTGHKDEIPEEYLQKLVCSFDEPNSIIIDIEDDSVEDEIDWDNPYDLNDDEEDEKINPLIKGAIDRDAQGLVDAAIDLFGRDGISGLEKDLEKLGLHIVEENGKFIVKKVIKEYFYQQLEDLIREYAWDYESGNMTLDEIHQAIMGFNNDDEDLANDVCAALESGEYKDMEPQLPLTEDKKPTTRVEYVFWWDEEGNDGTSDAYPNFESCKAACIENGGYSVEEQTTKLDENGEPVDFPKCKEI